MLNRAFPLIRGLQYLALAAWLAACSPQPINVVHAAAGSGGESATASASPIASSSPPPSPEGTAVTAALARAGDAFAATRWDDAAADIAVARDAAHTNASLLDRVASVDAALHVERGDVDGAAAILQSRIDAAANDHALREFTLHDQMIFLREAQGDAFGAYLEAEAMRSVADAQDLPIERLRRVRLGYTWQRAHTLRNYAEQLSGADRTLAMTYANAARITFDALARQLEHSLASIDVLGEQFATLDGHIDDALSAARRLNIADLDPQDLYLTLRTYLAAHDTAGVESVRAQLDRDHSLSLLTAVYRSMARRALAAPSASPAPRSRLGF